MLRAPHDTLLLGAVAYDPKVVTIWEGFRAWFAGHGLDFDYVLYANYERLVQAHLDGHVHVAWNSPLAWIEARRGALARGVACETVAMRDTDQDLTSVVVVRADAPYRTVADLAGARVGVGAGDSPQATLIPLHWLAEQGVEVRERRFDVLLGKHGDHIGGERDAARALIRGEVDAVCLIDGNHAAFTKEGTFPMGSVRVLGQTGPYDHCNMTVLGAGHPRMGRFVELLMSMSWDDPAVRPLLEMEGLRQWRPGRTEGYVTLEAAVERFGTVDAFLRDVARAAPR
ncbi:MAG: PhnD/SsuA/transferrin family substrate-binding protein [Myxococcota bacterium]